MVVVPIKQNRLSTQLPSVVCPAEVLKRILVFNTLLTHGMHDSWRKIVLKNAPADALQSPNLVISRQVEKNLKMSEGKVFDYADPVQWLAVLDDEDFNSLMLTLGALCLASEIKRGVLKQQVAQFKLLLGSELYAQVLKNEMSVFSEVYDRHNGQQNDFNLHSLMPLYAAASQILALYFADHSLFFKKRLALRLPCAVAEVLYQSKNLPTLSAEHLFDLHQAFVQLLAKVSVQWQQWST
jgi:hypothetical protein